MELKHHGILGMKWGVRRFQRPDGTRTAAGKRRERSAVDDAIRSAGKTRVAGAINKKQPKEKTMSDDDLRKSVQRMAMEKQYRNLSKANQGESKLDSAKKLLDASGQLTSQTRNALQPRGRVEKEALDLSKMSDDQLRKEINRFNLERQYNDIFAQPKQLERGKQAALNALDVGGALLAAGSSAVAIALAIKALKG